MERIVLLMDLDYFYAQVEILRNPGLKGKPVVVCMFSGRSEDSGAVAAACYEARKLGIRAGMPIARAKQLGKEAAFLPADREYYAQISDRVMEIMEEYGILEQVSIDEAYLDVSKTGDYDKALDVAKKIKERVKKQEKLTCSIGIGPNKLIAKMASGVSKPDGLTLVKENEARDFLKGMEVKKLFSVGPVAEKKLNDLGIKTVGDLSAFPEEKLAEAFGGKKGKELHDYANGIDNRPVEPREKQQLSRLASLKEDTNDPEKINDLLEELSGKLFERVRKENVKFRNVAFIGITKRLEMHTRSRTLEKEADDLETIMKHGKGLANEFLEKNPDAVLRRIGIRVAGFIRQEKVREQRRLEDF